MLDETRKLLIPLTNRGDHSLTDDGAKVFDPKILVQAKRKELLLKTFQEWDQVGIGFDHLISDALDPPEQVQ